MLFYTSYLLTKMMNNLLYLQLIHWYKTKHAIEISNIPTSEQSKIQLDNLVNNILEPINKVLGAVNITYGFTSPELVRYIQKNSPSGTAISLDQHASHEVNLKENRINKRDGAACDFLVKGYEKKMNHVVHFIVNNLNFDKIYYYGKDRPIHVSIGQYQEKHLQVMCISKNGRRYPGKRGFGESAVKLVEELIK